jgi:hypothetical protein
LFEISGIRGKYPQFFVMDEEKITFLGDWAEVEALNDASSLPHEILEYNPKIMTWDRVLGKTHS